MEQILVCHNLVHHVVPAIHHLHTCQLPWPFCSYFKLSRRPNPMLRLAGLPSERSGWSLLLMSKLWKGEVMFVTNVINSVTECALLKQRSSWLLSLRGWKVTWRRPGKNLYFSANSSFVDHCSSTRIYLYSWSKGRTISHGTGTSDTRSQ